MKNLLLATSSVFFCMILGGCTISGSAGGKGVMPLESGGEGSHLVPKPYAPPPKREWGSNRSYYPPVEEFHRKPYVQDFLLVNLDAAAASDSRHQEVLGQVLERINAVPLGQEGLVKLKQRVGQSPLFVASADPRQFHIEGSHTPLVTRAIELPGPDGKKSVAVYVNTEYLQKVFSQEGYATGVTPAMAMRDVHMGILRARQLMDRAEQGKLQDADRLFADEVWAALEGDKFYGQLTEQNHDGHAFNYELNGALANGGVPLTQPDGFLTFGGTVSGHLLDTMEIVDPVWERPYKKALAAAPIPSAARLAFELVTTGKRDKPGGKDGWKTPLRVVLNSLDERVVWDYIRALNKRLVTMGAPEVQIDYNSLVLRNVAVYAGAERLDEMARLLVTFPDAYTDKAGHAELIDRVIATLHQLVVIDKRYSVADVKDMVMGLKLPSRLRAYIDGLVRGGGGVGNSIK